MYHYTKILLKTLVNGRYINGNTNVTRKEKIICRI